MVGFTKRTSESSRYLKDSEGTVRLINRQHHFLYSSVFCPFGQEGDLPDDQTIDNTLARVKSDKNKPISM